MANRVQIVEASTVAVQQAQRGGLSRLRSDSSGGSAVVSRQAGDGAYARPSLQEVTDAQLAQGLGWFSIGLGVTEMLAPQALGRMIGIGDYHAILPLLGLREVASGVGILSNKRPAGWLW